jgi:hypothetical protein
MWFIYLSQLNKSLTSRPRNFTDGTFVIVLFIKFIISLLSTLLLLFLKWRKQVLLMFRDKRLAVNHRFMSQRDLYSAVLNTSWFGLFMMLLVSSANSTIFYFTVFNKGKSFIYMRNNRGSRIEPWGTLCLTSIHCEEASS